MGQGGFITLVNNTDYDWVQFYEHSYQMAQWDFPQVIKAHSRQRVYVEWQEGAFSIDDAGEVSYRVQDGKNSSFQIQARSVSGRRLQVYFDNWQTSTYPRQSTVNLGWYHDGNVTFTAGGDGGQIPEVCFLQGTRILTPQGYSAIENISLGQEIVAVEKGRRIPRKVIFVGHKEFKVDTSTSLMPDEAGWPVCIVKNALGDNIPCQDIWITPEHCVFLKDSFVPVRMLINNKSIYYDFSQPVYDYWHIGTLPHSIIISENIYTESYLYGDNFSKFSTITLSSLENNEFSKNIKDGIISKSFVPAVPINTKREFVEPLWNEFSERSLKIRK